MDKVFLSHLSYSDDKFAAARYEPTDSVRQSLHLTKLYSKYFQFTR